MGWQQGPVAHRNTHQPREGRATRRDKTWLFKKPELEFSVIGARSSLALHCTRSKDRKLGQ